MDKYSLENGFLTLVDEELGLSFKEPFAPMKVPTNPEQDQELKGGYLVKTSSIEEGILEGAYIEKEGKPDGQYLLFYPSGALKMETFYLSGALHGPSTFYNEDAVILTKSWFFHGKRQGKSYWYYPAKQLLSLQRFINGQWHGKQEYYYSDGTLKTIMHYNQGKLEGLTQLYSPKGKLIRELVVSRQ